LGAEDEKRGPRLSGSFRGQSMWDLDGDYTIQIPEEMRRLRRSTATGDDLFGSITALPTIFRVCPF